MSKGVPSRPRRSVRRYDQAYYGEADLSLKARNTQTLPQHSSEETLESAQEPKFKTASQDSQQHLHQSTYHLTASFSDFGTFEEPDLLSNAAKLPRYHTNKSSSLSSVEEQGVLKKR